MIMHHQLGGGGRWGGDGVMLVRDERTGLRHWVRSSRQSSQSCAEWGRRAFRLDSRSRPIALQRAGVIRPSIRRSSDYVWENSQRNLAGLVEVQVSREGSNENVCGVYTHDDVEELQVCRTIEWGR